MGRRHPRMPKLLRGGRISRQSVTAVYAIRDTFHKDETAFFSAWPHNFRHQKQHPQAQGREEAPNCCSHKQRRRLVQASFALRWSREPTSVLGAKIGEVRGVEYPNSPKRSMNTQIFQAWIEKFNDPIKSEGRHVILLLDNASCLRADQQFSNAKVCMLPPNTTAHLKMLASPGLSCSIEQPQEPPLRRRARRHDGALR